MKPSSISPSRFLKVFSLTIPLLLLSGASPALAGFTVTVHEQTGTVNTYTFDQDDIRLFNDIAGMPGPPEQGYIGYDFGTGGCEYYDIFFCDASGTVLDLSPGDSLPPDIYIRLECWDLSCNSWEPVAAPTWDSAGNNIDAVVLDIDGEVFFGLSVVEAAYGLCDEPFEEKMSGFASSALGPPDEGITKMGGGYSVITLNMRLQPADSCEIVVNYPHSETVYYIGGQHSIDVMPNTCDSLVSLELYKGGTMLCHIADISGRWYEWYGVDDCGGGTGWDYRIKATCLADTSCYDFSDYFLMLDGASSCDIVVNYPHSESEFYIGGHHTIGITEEGCGDLVRLELYKGQSLMCQISDMSGTQYDWNGVSDCGGGPGTDYRIKATCLDDSTCFGFSQYFSMVEGAGGCEVAVNSPDSETVFHIGGRHMIDIMPNTCDGDVRLELFKGGSLLCQIADFTGRWYEWEGVSDCGGGPGTDYRIRATCLADAGCYGFSDYFTLASQDTSGSALEHDPMTATGNTYFDWIENGVGWVASEGGYVFGNVPGWLDALISERAFDPAGEPVMIFRVYNSIDASNFMGGFTSDLPPENDFHYANIDIGVYLHSTGTIRPAWDVNNYGYWSTTLPAGYYDIKVALDGSAGTVTLAIDDVSGWSSPLSDFSDPVWSSVEQRPLEGPYHIQINPYNTGSRVYDVWAAGEEPAPPSSANPHILSIEDIGNDNGRQVRMRWQASAYDSTGSALPVTGYALWRRIDQLPEAMAIQPEPAPVPAAGQPPMYPPGDWDYLGTVPACCEEAYATVLPTLADSTVVSGMHWSVFFVRALTETPGTYFDSPPDSGWSVDDLAPPPPAGFSGAESVEPRGLRLYWEPGTAEDVVLYDIHKGAGEDFAPLPANLVGSTPGTELIDAGWIPGDEDYYKIIAVDRSGNAGDAALLRPENIYLGTYLQSFSASWTESWMEVSWTLSEIDEGVRFFVLRADGPGREFDDIDAAVIEREGLSFFARDMSCEPGKTYVYRVGLDEGGGRRIMFETGPVSAPAMPLALFQNTPNPFNPSTSIGFYLPERSRVRIDVYDVTGRLMSTLLDELRPGGSHTVEWNGLDRAGSRAASGVYFYRLAAGKSVLTRKMVLLR